MRCSMRGDYIHTTWLSLTLCFSLTATRMVFEASMAQSNIDIPILSEGDGKPGPFGPNDGSGGGKPKLADFAQAEYSAIATHANPIQVEKGESGPKGPNDGGGGNPKFLGNSQTSPPKPGPNDGGGGKLMDVGQKEERLHSKEDGTMILAKKIPPRLVGGPNSGGGKEEKKGHKAVPMNQRKSQPMP